jgi:magnesium chelatase family protein
MTSQVSTLTFNGINIHEVQVQTSIVPGLPNLIVVGLPDKIIAESRERVRAALHSIALTIPNRKILINLSPANLIKEGSHFDLPIALSLLIKLGVIPEQELQNYLTMGELALNGDILPVSGALPAAMGANQKDLGIICPEANGGEAAWSGNKLVLAPRNLLSLINHFKGTQRLSPPESKSYTPQKGRLTDFQEVIGQDTAKRALEIAAAGHHNLLLIGSPGSGKSMLSHSFQTILPAMTSEEILETSMLYSIAGELKEGHLQHSRPFRAPHHSASVPSIVGGGRSKRIVPGEISLAHNGVLFMDEFPEFPRDVLDSLRQPIEDGKIMISRAEAHVEYPANFQLLAAMNHCKCGKFKDIKNVCSKAPRCLLEYQNRIPGPILDRIDMFIEVDEISNYDLKPQMSAETSETIAKKVEAARAIQLARGKEFDIRTNSQLDGNLIKKFATPEPKGEELLQRFATKNRISLRSYSRILKVARTIADLDQKETIDLHHIAEALNYRAYYSI